MHALLFHRLFLVSYHQSPPARWWHARWAHRGIRVQCGGAQSARRPPPGRGTHASVTTSHCRWDGAGWAE
ncbi:hypothetical protein STRIP9103_06564 [Streptomyces ipomoeae 91-03]|uniref:Uncharacterized protein n=1 Tax=Streptomyces ipomoeae 91-03 TaxID=698759 RepID=L1L8V2_9ACTN|nr:hypothetical protein STRIP9103_06564 [Streptomyces ipomoeae 91-03]